MTRPVTRPRRQSGEAAQSVRLVLEGGLDHETADEVLSAVDAALSDRTDVPAELLLDCSAVSACDALGLSCLLMVRRRADAAGVPLRLQGIPQHMRRLFARTGTWGHLVSEAEHTTPSTRGRSFPRARERKSTDMIDEPAAVVTHAPEGDMYLVGVVGDIDYDSATELETALRSAATEPSCERTVVDLSGTDFADSTILNVLLSAQQAHRHANRPLFVAGPFSRTVHRLFDVTGTADYFTLVPTVVDARARP